MSVRQLQTEIQKELLDIINVLFLINVETTEIKRISHPDGPLCSILKENASVLNKIKQLRSLTIDLNRSLLQQNITEDLSNRNLSYLEHETFRDVSRQD